ncbi:MAG TPA: bifunctional tetrahydrofolate synthase/dihydrofolate synthase [Rudaea sp.]|nr:bifunctional tetrahydrofolate synthase/dihydrofolate synthase [Rudaea sp.]
MERSLSEWLDYQQRIHPRDIELGLDRVRDVWNRMGAPPSAPVVITVGGTNGKGSTVAFLEAMLAASGRRVGCYTSPHLLRYNERVRVLGADVDDASLIAAFERIESARQEIPLTYFEFGTLAALWIFAQSKLDVAVLEVGLGGRLDAVNIIDADAAIVTTVDLDHQDWLGNDVDTIGREKAGIFRDGRPAIIGMREPPRGLLETAQRIGARVLRAGPDFEALVGDRRWIWMSGETALELPFPTLAAPVQINNAASAVATLRALSPRIAWDPDAIAAGVREASLAARLQRFTKDGAADLVIDVGHNPQAARVLATWLQADPSQRTVAVFGALSDKDVAGIVTPLRDHIGSWHVAGIDAESPRGLSAADVAIKMKDVIDPASIEMHFDVADALDAASSHRRHRMIAFGSFFVAAAALAWAQRRGYGAASGSGQV